jgi:hypothetical protein
MGRGGYLPPCFLAPSCTSWVGLRAQPRGTVSPGVCWAPPRGPHYRPWSHPDQPAGWKTNSTFEPPLKFFFSDKTMGKRGQGWLQADNTKQPSQGQAGLLPSPTVPRTMYGDIHSPFAKPTATPEHRSLCPPKTLLELLLPPMCGSSTWHPSPTPTALPRSPELAILSPQEGHSF